MQRLTLIAVLIPFTLLSVVALFHHGYQGIFQLAFQTFGGAQVLADLFIAISLFLIWLWNDARENNRNPWPWILISLTLGSFGPLMYLLIYKTGPSCRTPKVH